MRPPVVALGFLWAFALALLCYGVAEPQSYTFDEFHYVPAAKRLIAGEPMGNTEHPPLGKYLIASGIVCAGDTPIGWRMPSVIFGGATLIAIFQLALLWFGSLPAALGVGFMTIFGQAFYVQSRIGMLDPFMTAFLFWGIYFFERARRSPQDFRFLAATGVSLGLALAVKWFAVVAWLPLGVYTLYQVLQSNQKRTPKPMLKRLVPFVVAWGVIPLGVYFVSFLPLLVKHNPAPTGLWESLKLFVSLQKGALGGQLRVVQSHPYEAAWWGWPLMLRPIWYTYEKSTTHPEWVRAIALIGNPLIFWGGCLALLSLVVQAVKKKSQTALTILGWFFLLWLSWAVIPRKIFFFYYYYPASLLLPFAITQAFLGEASRLTTIRRRVYFGYIAASGMLFIYFYPVLAGFPVPSAVVYARMWFRSWI